MKIYELISNSYLESILESDKNESCWSQDLTAEQILSEIGINSNSTVQGARETVFRRCDSYKQTYLQKVKPYDSVRRKFADFMELKRWNPTHAFGKSDRGFVSGGVVANLMPNLKHAHITGDLSILYKLERGVIWLYGFYTHGELGTDKSSQVSTLKNSVLRMMKKTEADCPIGVKRPQPRYR